ncbi:MmcQ/YjbR family DNA-binding protein [Brevundimonas goettingensis]|uniref:MmcQ/YjbR family DNA-binding protein n=1 Tax=Brevundimonas goettingensis TaxID=2774190 RepID=A0A975GUR7_9CAUL|nr:MmcQ/YjbR family DNA-binding protein [Brevundimonas goettingensis]QTC90551.1 MmcQ/YjbR family DNA-binding protein [Brevundimonas goettingensis]
MATPADLARIALALPGVSGEGVGFGVGKKGLCWSYLARATPKAKREVVPGVVAIRCDLAAKEMLIETVPDRFFDDDHYRGYPAVLARLETLEVSELEGLIRSAWMIQAPKSLKRGLA